MGDFAQSNIETMWDFEFWRQYLDRLARQRAGDMSRITVHRSMRIGTNRMGTVDFQEMERGAWLDLEIAKAARPSAPVSH